MVELITIITIIDITVLLILLMWLWRHGTKIKENKTNLQQLIQLQQQLNNELNQYKEHSQTQVKYVNDLVQQMRDILNELR